MQDSFNFFTFVCRTTTPFASNWPVDTSSSSTSSVESFFSRVPVVTCCPTGLLPGVRVVALRTNGFCFTLLAAESSFIRLISFNDEGSLSIHFLNDMRSPTMRLPASAQGESRFGHVDSLWPILPQYGHPYV